MLEVQERSWSLEDHETWRRLFERLAECRASQAHPMFSIGVEKLGITEKKIPNLTDVNRKLEGATGWRGVFVDGLVDGRDFLLNLSKRRFPVGNFIRLANDLNYTPAPDIFHDLYGHLPFLVDPSYAKFCENLGSLVERFQDSPTAVRMCERLFWFGVEFPLVKTPSGRRIFGGGILSSFGESNYCLSPEPVVVAFNLKDIVFRDYKIDEMQSLLFELDSPDHLYGCLAELESLLSKSEFR